MVNVVYRIPEGGIVTPDFVVEYLYDRPHAAKVGTGQSSDRQSEVYNPATGTYEPRETVLLN